MSRHSIYLTQAVVVVIALGFFRASAQDAKTAAPAPPVNVKLALDKTDPPIPVKFAFSVEVPEFCLTGGLDAMVAPVRLTGQGCGAGKVRAATNEDDLIAAFGKASEFVVQKGDEKHLLFFCAARECDARRYGAIASTIRAMARPSPRYFEDEAVPAGVTAKDLADAIERITKGKATGRMLASDKVRVETDKKLEPPQITNLREIIAAATTDSLQNLPEVASPLSAKRIQLPSFCIAMTLDGRDPTVYKDPAPCPADMRLAPTANAAEIAAALTGDKIKVTTATAAALNVSCGAAKCESDALALIASGASSMARPRPAYIEDATVLRGTATASVAKVAAWSGALITATVLSDETIRLQSDVKAVTDDLAILRRRLLDEGFGEPATLPVKQMFYSDAGAVVSSLQGAPPAAATLAPGTTPPDTTGASAASAPAASAVTTFAAGMMPVGDSVVLSGNATVNDSQRVKLLTLLDLPRPEVLMNLWSLQESSPNGKELAKNSEIIRTAVSIHNEALQNAIEYGWAYLSRQLKIPGFANDAFTTYLTKRFVSAMPCGGGGASPGCITQAERAQWGLCPEDTYCLGYTEAFQPLKPTLTNILVGLMAANDPFRAVFTAIGCMEGKYEVYSECFPVRGAMELAANGGLPSPPEGLAPAVQDRMMVSRKQYLDDHVKNGAQPSCEDLDRAALYAQRESHLTAALPLSCFTIQAAKSFVPYHDFSTLTTSKLNELAERRIVDFSSVLPPMEQFFSATPLGLLRSATINFLFNYKMAQQFPREFSGYALTHSAQELNAELNPLVVAFNQDVGAFSRDLMEVVTDQLHESHWYTFPWDGRNKSFAADGVVTVRGISGVESLVDTETQSAFNAPQYQTLPSVLSNLAGLAGGAPAAITDPTTANASSALSPTAATAPPSSNLLSLLQGGWSKASLPLALASAVSPTAAKVQIGRQLTLDVVPHTLPGASSAELEVKLWAQEDSPPTLYKDGGTGPQNDPLSRVARHNVFTRVRVESVKLFEVSSFSAMVQRPRSKFPLIPPFVEIPVVTDLLGLPLPGAKVYHRSTAIVSAIIVPTASDLAFGMEYAADRATVGEGASRSFRRISSPLQLPPREQRIYQFNQAAANCFATTVSASGACAGLTFGGLAPDR